MDNTILSLELLISCVGLFVFSVSLYFLNMILFFPKYTEKQKKRIKRMYQCQGIFFIFYFLIEMMMDVGRQGFFLSVFDKFAYIYAKSNLTSIFITMIMILSYLILMYVAVAGRIRYKWVGFFSFLILTGYVEMLQTIIDIPAYFLRKHYIFQSVYQIIAYIAILLFFLWINSEKHKPAFLRRIEEDSQSRSLSFREEAGIWLIGIWFLISQLLIPDLEGVGGAGNFEQMPDSIIIYLYLTNFILGITVTALIITGSYRRYYYEKNLKLQKSLINTMANLVESRDDNTGGHIHRTAKYVEIIARKLQKEGKFKDILTDQYIEDMVIAAPLHDVGKIHIPDAILNKPGRLDADEFNTMKTHSSAGGGIIDQVEDEVGKVSYLSIAKDMAEYHHERIDGKGYPHEIGGEEIPVSARILAVADVFDALISKRCYKESMPLDKAFAIIKEETGDHFDPDIAKAFLDSREEVEQFLNEAGA